MEASKTDTSTIPAKPLELRPRSQKMQREQAIRLPRITHSSLKHVFLSNDQYNDLVSDSLPNSATWQGDHPNSNIQIPPGLGEHILHKGDSRGRTLALHPVRDFPKIETTFHLLVGKVYFARSATFLRVAVEVMFPYIHNLDNW